MSGLYDHDDHDVHDDHDDHDDHDNHDESDKTHSYHGSSRSFGRALTMEYMDSPRVKIYIHDRSPSSTMLKMIAS